MALGVPILKHFRVLCCMIRTYFGNTHLALILRMAVNLFVLISQAMALMNSLENQTPPKFFRVTCQVSLNNCKACE